MVKIAIAGASGNVAQELVNFLIPTQKHEIILLSRKATPFDEVRSEVTWVQVDYRDLNQLSSTLRGVHTLLCFFTSQTDPENSSQKNLINAAVKAKVRRYAPSEWAFSSFEYMPWSTGKAEIREYLKKLNEEEQILEYSLFQIGMFTDYLASPYQTSKHIHPLQTHFDFNNRRAIVLDGSANARMNLISSRDFCAAVSAAIEYEGKWPVDGGIRADELTVNEIIALGEKIRGPFSVEVVQPEDAKRGILKTTWLPRVEHPAISADQTEKMAAELTAGLLLATPVGAWSVSNEWNKLLPDLEFVKAEDFLAKAWSGKP